MYLEDFAEGCPEQYWPCGCFFCGADRKQHYHSHYLRTVYTLIEAHLITVYRFQCPFCNKTQGLLPSFVGCYERVSFDVKERVVREHAEGASLAEIAANLAVAGGPYSEKTIWRWTIKCNKLLKDLGSLVWEQALKVCPHIDLPVGATKPRSEWGWLLNIWDQTMSLHPIENMLSRLYRLQCSLSVAPG
jgi:hypothetical protein